MYLNNLVESKWNSFLKISYHWIKCSLSYHWCVIKYIFMQIVRDTSSGWFELKDRAWEFDCKARPKPGQRSRTVLNHELNWAMLYARLLNHCSRRFLKSSKSPGNEWAAIFTVPPDRRMPSAAKCFHPSSLTGLIQTASGSGSQGNWHKAGLMLGRCRIHRYHRAGFVPETQSGRTTAGETAWYLTWYLARWADS